MPPREIKVRFPVHGHICKIGLSKMQFPAFPGPELGNWKGLFGC